MHAQTNNGTPYSKHFLTPFCGLIFVAYIITEIVRLVAIMYIVIAIVSFVDKK